MGKEIPVWAIDARFLGYASNFVEAKAMQLASLPDHIKQYYAGISAEGDPLFDLGFVKGLGVRNVD